MDPRFVAVPLHFLPEECAYDMRHAVSAQLVPVGFTGRANCRCRCEPGVFQCCSCRYLLFEERPGGRTEARKESETEVKSGPTQGTRRWFRQGEANTTLKRWVASSVTRREGWSYSFSLSTCEDPRPPAWGLDVHRTLYATIEGKAIREG